MVKYSVTGDLHTEEGVAELGKSFKRCLVDRYSTLAEAMFKWEDSSGRSDEMFSMSINRVPEKFLVTNTRSAIFDWAGKTHILPLVQTNQVNIYGEMTTWRLAPVAWSDDPFYKDLLTYDLDIKNSSIILNTIHGWSTEFEMIRNCVSLMVDAMLTLNQRVLMARAPFLLATDGVKGSDESTYMNAILNYKPWIVKNVRASTMEPTITNLDIALDPSLIDVTSFWNSQILNHLGYPCTDVHKRAQQSVSETNMTQHSVDKIRESKLRCREFACEKFNKLYSDSDLQVISTLDEYDMGGKLGPDPTGVCQAMGAEPES